MAKNRHTQQHPSPAVSATDPSSADTHQTESFTGPSPSILRHVPDHAGVTAELRRLVDATHGEDYAILSAGKERAYIENRARGFDILVATGEKA